MDARIPGQWVNDILDIAARVFRLKLKELISDLKMGMHFGVVVVGI